MDKFKELYKLSPNNLDQFIAKNTVTVQKMN